MLGRAKVETVYDIRAGKAPWHGDPQKVE